MFSKIRKLFTYANVTMTLALVFAMSGGAYAASKYLITSTKQISPKVLKALKGKNGANGTNGSAGTQGAQGPQGLQGTAGKEGAAGTPGTPGKDGVSVASKTLVKEDANCKEGGSEFAAESKKTYACNGSAWTAGGTLPKGAEEKGVWNDVGTKEGAVKLESISFGIPLKTAPTEVEFVKETPTAHCPGSAKNPTATEGYLCVYDSVPEAFVSVNPGFSNPGELFGPGHATKSGTLVRWETKLSIEMIKEGLTETLDQGTWAVAGD
jgi:hypothetical protein